MIQSDIAKATALESPSTLATVLHAILKKTYGPSVYTWDPTTVMLELRDDFKVSLPPENVDKWSAMSLVMTSDAFFTRLDAFLNVCNTLSTGDTIFQVFDPVTTEELAWGIAEVALNRELMPFSHAIRTYVKKVLADDGYGESDYPDIFAEVLGDKDPEAQDIRRALRSPGNDAELDSYLDDQLRNLVVQFDRIQDLKELDNILLHRGMDEFVGTIV